MARFDIYPNPWKSVAAVPYVVDVQSDFVSGLPTRLVIPLRLRATLSQALPPDLCPLFTVEGKECFLATAELAAVPAQSLKLRVASAHHRSLEIGSALDRIFGHP